MIKLYSKSAVSAQTTRAPRRAFGADTTFGRRHSGRSPGRVIPSNVRQPPAAHSPALSAGIPPAQNVTATLNFYATATSKTTPARDEPVLLVPVRGSALRSGNSVTSAAQRLPKAARRLSSRPLPTHLQAKLTAHSGPGTPPPQRISSSSDRPCRLRRRECHRSTSHRSTSLVRHRRRRHDRRRQNVRWRAK